MQKHFPLFYQIFGEDSSSKLVFLHGIMGQGRNWMSIAKKFSTQYQCLIYDQRGHGRSIQPDSGYQIDDYVEDLRQLLDHLGWQKIKLVGHSMGGRVALLFADRYPERVEKLVIVDIGPNSDWTSMGGVLEKLDFVPVPFTDRAAAREFMENEFLSKYPNKMVMEFFYSNLAERNGQYDWIFSKSAIRQSLETARHKDYWAEFKNLEMPTLFLRGENSPDLPREDFAKVLQANPRIKGVEIAGAGHWVHAEKPLEAIRIIDEFFIIAANRNQ